MREIINTHQVKILTALAKNHSSTRSALIPLSDVYQSRFNLELTDLRERGLVSYHDTKRRGVKVTVFDISESGAKALADHEAHQARLAVMPGKALPPKINIYELPTWMPPKNTYVRNNGNVHVPSRGMSV